VGIVALHIGSLNTLEAQCIVAEHERLLSTVPEAGAQFGQAVDLCGDLAGVGSPYSGASGAVEIFRFDGTTWVAEQTLTPSDGGDGDRFGSALAVLENVIAVGAPGHQKSGFNFGAVYIFRHDGATWIEEQKITPIDFGGFGRSLALDADLLVVGMSSVGVGGAAIVYRFDGATWIEEQILSALDADPGDAFGSAVAIAAQTVILAGAFRDETSAAGAGSAYVFRHVDGTWIQEQKLIGSELVVNNYFGGSVSLGGEGDLALIGAPHRFAKLPEGNFGSAYIFRFDGETWVEEEELTPRVAIADSGFGIRVSLSGSLALVSAWIRVGLPSIFRYDGSRWSEEHVLVPSRLRGSGFGLGAALDGDTAIVGSPYDDCQEGGSCGSAFVFEGLSRPGCPSGTVNAGAGLPTEVLFVNGSPGDVHRTIDVPPDEPITVSLSASPAGPDPGPFALWVWIGAPTGCFELATNGSAIGCFSNPTPLHLPQAPQPVVCLESANLPNALCRAVGGRPGPAAAPFVITRNRGFGQGDFVLQGIIADDGSAHPSGYSVTNVALLRIRP
jgi:hypothetical protein